MTTTKGSHSELANTSLLIKRIFIGALIGLAIISFFIFGADSEPEWEKYWRLRPLIVTPSAGALAGLFSYFMTYSRKSYGWNKALTISLTLLIYVIGLWMGVIVGLDGTLWD